ncbi:hypothetical protein T05_12387 [Trichinella murrelli]|uniref:Uncharacterized protein n=1 Tax=Trichinella murrelli TaxID=144512 RepID=A0A0V0TW56_9BILA|nr:hypothetical protein T05_12387 [Trichinella murrelli]
MAVKNLFVHCRYPNDSIDSDQLRMVVNLKMAQYLRIVALRTRTFHAQHVVLDGINIHLCYNQFVNYYGRNWFGTWNINKH